MQNINFTITEKEYDLSVTRPDFEYLTFVTSDAEYRMERVAPYQYELQGTFPQKVKGYIKSPKASTQGNEVFFGWENGAITQGSVSPISFSNSSAGEYVISFNSKTYEAAPFIKLLVEGKEMQMIDDDNYKIDLSLSQGQKLSLSGFPDYNQWWIDPDFFIRGDDGKLEFLPLSGNYRVIANFKHKYFIVEALKDGNPASLQSDGTGAIWIIGDGIGKPGVAQNQVSWNTDKALYMSQIQPKKYQVTVIAGTSIATNNINFKFFHQKGWGGEYGSTTISTTSDVILIGNGTNGRDNGNLGLVEGRTLETGATYVFTVDVTEGIAKAVLTVVKK